MSMSMSNISKRIQSIHPEDRKCVMGYLNKYSKKYKIFGTWPIAITWIVMLYVCIEMERLLLKYNNDHDWVSSNSIGNQIKFTEESQNIITFWGSKEISNEYAREYVWNLHINSRTRKTKRSKDKGAFNCFIGISNKTSESRQRIEAKSCLFALQSPRNYYYGISHIGDKITQEGKYRDDYRYKDWGYHWPHKVKLKISFNCIKQRGKLKFWINNEHQYYANFNSVKFLTPKGDKIVYTLCISFWAAYPASITLQSFEEKGNPSQK